MHVHPMYPLPMSSVTQRIRSNPHIVTCPWRGGGGGGMHVHPMYPLPMSSVTQRIRSNPHIVTCPWRGGNACASHVPPAYESGDPAHQVKCIPCDLPMEGGGVHVHPMYPPAYESGDPAHQVKPTPCDLPGAKIRKLSFVLKSCIFIIL